MTDRINFSLSRNDAGGLINLLGQLPTSSGVFPLHQLLANQFNEQVNAPPQPPLPPPPEPDPVETYDVAEAVGVPMPT